MKSLKNTQTEKNLMAAFAGESQARNRYTFFSSKAKSDGFVQVSSIFNETADQEKEHAKRLFKFMEGGEIEITGSFPAGVIADTHTNLIASAGGEHHEYTEMYPSFAAVAEKEGFPEIAAVFRNIAVAEQFHERRFLDFAKNIKEGRVFKREGKTAWRCRNCGFIHEGPEAPGLCPACAHPQAHFEMLGINW
ncbi:Rubrerythrin [Desulfovibrio sp. X2]|uniref:rubrerythrin n=1 Tax=Desulfovibrio sp. X2 TaxID=941449 RepID=UPI000358C17B|nr:rubrerythrin family protein [Desulfovibrio sp. X2]EPR41224.1 Rubrerythrin [Desulfovibrio sp. X2]